MKILFKIYPQKSHLNATFPLARGLRELGHEIQYAGVRELETHVVAQGFSYHVQSADIFPYVENQATDVKLTFWLAFRMWWKNRRWGPAMRSRFASVDPFGPLIRATSPDAILVDSPYTILALSLLRRGIPFGITESMMNLKRAAGCTPLDTAYVPHSGWWSALVIRCHWRRYFIKRWILGALGFRADFSRTFVRARALAAGVSESCLDSNRYFHPGIKTVPEFILSPEPLDFPRQPSAHQIYVGPSVLIDRTETASDYRFDAEFARVVAERKRGRPLVYCSLGTAGWRYKGAEAFLRRVIAAAEGQPWNLIVAIGANFDPAQFRGHQNASVFQVVPQLRVLRHADLMITHGGMNSITECVLSGVPMLVYPGTTQIDQAGNAARVVYHQLGLQGKLTRDPAREIARKTTAILANPTYASRTRAMAERIETSEAWTHGAERVVQALQRSFPTAAARFGSAQRSPSHPVCTTAVT